jgi:hypothetical protein
MIRLHRIVRRLDPSTNLEPALRAIALGRSVIAGEELAQVDRALAKKQTAGIATRRALRARGIVLALSEALTQHMTFFDSRQ